MPERARRRKDGQGHRAPESKQQSKIAQGGRGQRGGGTHCVGESVLPRAFCFDKNCSSAIGLFVVTLPPVWHILRGERPRV